MFTFGAIGASKEVLTFIERREIIRKMRKASLLVDVYISFRMIFREIRAHSTTYGRMHLNTP
jgi:hypothetical protein